MEAEEEAMHDEQEMEKENGMDVGCESGSVVEYPEGCGEESSTPLVIAEDGQMEDFSGVDFSMDESDGVRIKEVKDEKNTFDLTTTSRGDDLRSKERDRALEECGGALLSEPHFKPGWLQEDGVRDEFESVKNKEAIVTEGWSEENECSENVVEEKQPDEGGTRKSQYNVMEESGVEETGGSKDSVTGVSEVEKVESEEHIMKESGVEEAGRSEETKEKMEVTEVNSETVDKQIIKVKNDNKEKVNKTGMEEDVEEGELEEGELEEEEGEKEIRKEEKAEELEKNEKEDNKENRGTDVDMKDNAKNENIEAKDKKRKDDRKRKQKKETDEEKRNKKKRKHFYNSEDEELTNKKFTTARDKSFDFDALLKQEMYMVGSSANLEGGESQESGSGEDWEEKPRRRSPRKRRPSRSPSRKNEAICMFYIQGSCKRGGDCPYSHEMTPARKMELCKFYMMDCCAKREKCLYMHKDFPCKFFHFGMKCVAGEHCKFSHDSLHETTRNILLKHIELAPKDILGDFPRVSKHNAQVILDVTEAKRGGESVEAQGLEDVLELEGKGFKYLDKALKNIRKKKDGDRKPEKEKGKESKEKEKDKDKEKEKKRDKKDEHRDKKEKNKEKERGGGIEKERERVRDRDRGGERDRKRVRDSERRSRHRSMGDRANSSSSLKQREFYNQSNRVADENVRPDFDARGPSRESANKWYSSDDEPDVSNAQEYRRSEEFSSPPKGWGTRGKEGPHGGPDSYRQGMHGPTYGEDSCGPGTHTQSPGHYNQGPGPHNQSPGPHNQRLGPYNEGPGPLSPTPRSQGSGNFSEGYRGPNQGPYPVQPKLPDIDVMYLKNVLSAVQNNACQNLMPNNREPQNDTRNSDWDTRNLNQDTRSLDGDPRYSNRDPRHTDRDYRDPRNSDRDYRDPRNSDRDPRHTDRDYRDSRNSDRDPRNFDRDPRNPDRDYRDPRDPSKEQRYPKEDYGNTNWGRNSNWDADFNREPQISEWDKRNPNVDQRNPNVDQRNPNVDQRNPNVDQRNPNVDRRNSQQGYRNSTWDPNSDWDSINPRNTQHGEPDSNRNDFDRKTREPDRDTRTFDKETLNPNMETRNFDKDRSNPESDISKFVREARGLDRDTRNFDKEAKDLDRGVGKAPQRDSNQYLDMSNAIKEVFYDEPATDQKEEFTKNLNSLLQNARRVSSGSWGAAPAWSQKDGGSSMSSSFTDSADPVWNQRDKGTPETKGYEEKSYGVDPRYSRAEFGENKHPMTNSSDLKPPQQEIKPPKHEPKARIWGATPDSRRDSEERTSSIYDFDFEAAVIADTPDSPENVLDSDLPFKVPMHSSAKEIQAGLNPLTPIYYRLIEVHVPKPDFSRLKLDRMDPKLCEDPRLRKMLRRNSNEGALPLSPRGGALEAHGLPTSPPLQGIEPKGENRDPRKMASRDPRGDPKMIPRPEPRVDPRIASRGNMAANNTRVDPRTDRDPRADMRGGQIGESDPDPRIGNPVFVNGMMDGGNYPQFPANVGGMPTNMGGANVSGMQAPMLQPCIDPRGRPGLLGPAPGQGPESIPMGIPNQLPQGMPPNPFLFPQGMGGPSPGPFLPGDRGEMMGAPGLPNFLPQGQWRGGGGVNFSDPRINRDMDRGGFTPS